MFGVCQLHISFIYRPHSQLIMKNLESVFGRISAVCPPYVSRISAVCQPYLISQYASNLNESTLAKTNLASIILGYANFPPYFFKEAVRYLFHLLDIVPSKYARLL